MAIPVNNVRAYLARVGGADDAMLRSAPSYDLQGGKEELKILPGGRLFHGKLDSSGQISWQEAIGKEEKTELLNLLFRFELENRPPEPWRMKLPGKPIAESAEAKATRKGVEKTYRNVKLYQGGADLLLTFDGMPEFTYNAGNVLRPFEPATAFRVKPRS